MEPLENNTADTAPAAPSRWSGLGVRIASSMVLIAVFIGILCVGGWLFTWLTMAAALMMMREWNALTERDGPLWRFAGIFYVTIPCASLVWLRNVRFEHHADAGLYLVLFVMVCVWATDIGAYFAGRQIGGPKLAPVISPNKTWAGLGGGVVASAIAAGISKFFMPYPTSFIVAIMLGCLLAVIGQAGDLFESWMKRRADVKDSGTLIPGHGGLLDRIDGLTLALPIFAIIVYSSGFNI